jgi:nitroreductase
VTGDRGTVWRAILTKQAVGVAPDPGPGAPRPHPPAGARQLGNLQRWDFVVCRDRDHLELSKVGPWAHLAARRSGSPSSPPTRPHRRPLSVMFDPGQAAGTMMLAAWELGIGSVPATVYEHDLARHLLSFRTHHCSTSSRSVTRRVGRPQRPEQVRRPKPLAT